MKKSFKSRVIALLKKDKEPIEEIADNSIIDKRGQYNTDECSEIKALTDTIVEHINAMTNKQVSYSNVNYLFKRDPTLQIFAIACIDTLEDKGIDSRDLSFAFSNSFTDHERCLDAPTEILLEDGKYILEVPHIVIERAMLWLTEQAILDSPYNAKIKRGIPQVALKSNFAFDVFQEKMKRNEHC
jgi:hypothetical protein